MKLTPDLGSAYPRPVPGREDAHHQHVHPRPVHRRALQPRPAQHRGEGRGIPEVHGIADTAFFAPEAEFYIFFDSVRFETKQNAGFLLHRLGRGQVELRSRARARRKPQPWIQDPYKGGYFPVPPVDHYADLRDQMTKTSARWV